METYKYVLVKVHYRDGEHEYTEKISDVYLPNITIDEIEKEYEAGGYIGDYREISTDARFITKSDYETLRRLGISHRSKVYYYCLD